METGKMARVMLVLAAAVIFVATGLPAPAAAVTPMEEVRTSVDAIFAVLRDADLTLMAKKDRVDAIARKSFDFRVMSQGVLATNWKKANGAEKERFVELFSDLLIGTYREKVEAYRDEEVKYLGEKLKGIRAEVDTLVISAGVEIPMKYKVLQRGEKWLAYDIVIEGVSLLRNYRESYREIVKKEGMEGLLTQMERKVEELKGGGESGGE
jgi:phospholipid transport system substrate-binding protein